MSFQDHTTVSGWLYRHVVSVCCLSRPCPVAGLSGSAVSYVHAANLSRDEVPLERRHEGLIMGNVSVQNNK